MAREPYRNVDATVAASRAAAVTPSDSVSIEICRGLYVGTGGNVSVVMADVGNTVVFVGVGAGSILPIQVSRVNLTGSSASDIIALY